LDEPWLTIQHAAQNLVAGDTVLIREGTYHESVYIAQSGNKGTYIVFSAYPNKNPVIDGNGVTESQNGLIINQSYITLSGLEICNWEENAIWVEQAGYIEISDCEIHDVCYGIGFALKAIINSIANAGGDNIGLAFEQMSIENYRGDYNLFHNNNPDRAIVVGYEDEFSLDQLDRWQTYSGQDDHSFVTHTLSDIFANHTQSDFHLSEDSLAVDQGTEFDAPAEDYEGKPRPQGKGYDMGAYEK